MIELKLSESENLFRSMLCPISPHEEFDPDTLHQKAIEDITTNDYFAPLATYVSEPIILPEPFSGLIAKLTVHGDHLYGKLAFSFAVPEKSIGDEKRERDLVYGFHRKVLSRFESRAAAKNDLGLVIEKNGEPYHVIQPDMRSYATVLHFGQAGAMPIPFIDHQEFKAALSDALKAGEEIVKCCINEQFSLKKRTAQSRYVLFEYDG